MKLLETKSLYYSDVNLIAKKCKLTSRKEVPFEGDRIFVAPMTAVIGPAFLKAYSKLPGKIRPSICLPRISIEYLDLLKDISNKTNVFISVGLEDSSYLEGYAQEHGFSILVDVANGYMEKVCRKVDKLADKSIVMSGNVHTREGYFSLYNCGASHIRVGIASGAGCATKDATGYNRGQITEISECYKDYLEAEEDLGVNAFNAIVADGGIRSSGDIVKAFGAGAGGIMAGKLFAYCREAENVQRGSYTYYGMASEQGKRDMGLVSDHIEGKSFKLHDDPDYYDKAPTLEETLMRLWDGIKSGISYSGYDSVSSFIGNGVFERLG